MLRIYLTKNEQYPISKNDLTVFGEKDRDYTDFFR